MYNKKYLSQDDPLIEYTCIVSIEKLELDDLTGVVSRHRKIAEWKCQ